MKLRNSVGGNAPFEGDLTFRWQTIPANAKILRATATVTPVDSKLGGPFTELLRFTNGTGDFGATKAGGTSGGRSWVEVDFHSRRTLAGITGSFGAITGSTGGCELQVDVGGGTYVEINQNGAFRTPSDPPDSFFRVEGSAADLPGLTVAKLKATTRDTGAPLPGFNTLRLRSVPTQVSLRVGELPPFWTHVGEMTLAETTSDFAAVLQTVLTTAKVENGFYDLPVTIHSDSIARLKINLEIEILARQDVLPKAVPEIVLPFDNSTLSKSTASELLIKVPLNSRAVVGQTSARVRGSFTETRIAFGPTGPDYPTAAIEVSPTYSQAQIFEVGNKVSEISADREISAVAVDLLLEALTPSARLQLDIRGDFDGKPDEIPLLPSPVEFAIEQRPEKGGTWTSVQLPAEFLFAKAKDKPTRYWLLLQSLEGKAAWSVIEQLGKSTATTANVLPNAQRTGDGGLSWQNSSLIATSLRDRQATPPYVALLRLRDKPKTFKMPIKLLVGGGKNAVEKKLDRFEPLGRVDFTLDTDLAEGINKYLSKIVPFGLPEAEHLINPGFEQWLKVGDALTWRPGINGKASIVAIAFAPDGTLVYLLHRSSLRVVDVDCNQEIKEIDLSFDTAKAFVIHPNGTRAYVTNGSRLQIVNLEIGAELRPAHDLVPRNVSGGTDEQEANALALTSDGERLYVATLKPGNNISPPINEIRIIDTAKMEQQLTSGVTTSSVVDQKSVAASSEQAESPIALAVSSDANLLYLLIDRNNRHPDEPSAVVQILDTVNFINSKSPVTVGFGATALALTPDGKRAVVTNKGSDSVSIIDTASATATSVRVGPSPNDVALFQDGVRAYVVNESERFLSVVDINRRLVIDNITLNDATPPASLIALSPLEDQIYLTGSEGSRVLSSVQFGARVPAEWQRTSGEVRPACLPHPFHLVAVMGSTSLPTSLSQVVPVVAPAAYEFSFWGIAVEPREDEPPAVAEVLWLNSACGLLQTDSLPIEAIESEKDGQRSEIRAGIAASATEQQPLLIFHRKQLTAPDGADQAEVRFSVSRNAGAIIDLVSLAATSELVANGDFQLRKNNQLVGWNLVPEQTPGFRADATAEGIQLSNPGSAQVELVQTIAAELVQTIAAESEQSFALQFQGEATAVAPSDTPRIELRWLDAGGAATGDPTLLPILPTGLDSAIASGTAPKDSTSVEIHLVVPPKTTLHVKRVSLRHTATTTVPVKFIAEAPGDLTVSDVQISFEQSEPKAPRIGPQGLCNATPPGREPGKGGDSCYCHKCELETLMMEATAVMTEAGRPATKARCSTCKTQVVRAGGPLVARVEALSPQSVGAPVMVRSAALTSTRESQAVGPAPQLTDIRGIGQARAKQLTEIGIDSVAKLAASTPETVAKIKFITPSVAAQIISQAKSRST